jgi:hypothetical protein
MTILVDHNLKGHALLLWGTLAAEGWFALLPLRLLTFEDAGLPVNSSDRAVWRFAQAKRMLLLTGNRSMKGPDSLEQTIREENTLTSLPVIQSLAHIDSTNDSIGNDVVADLSRLSWTSTTTWESVVSSFPSCADTRLPLDA